MSRVKADVAEIGAAPTVPACASATPATSRSRPRRPRRSSRTSRSRSGSSAVVVILSLVVFYGWGRAVPALFLPLFAGAAYAFALASLPPFRVTALNSNTAFLGSIIVGNGVNFGIIQLARYVEERRRGISIERALEIALDATRKGTLSAALAAGVAYGSLVAMQFRGFRQFGIIGGLGMVLVWAMTFVLGPPLIAWLDGGRLAHRRARPPRRRFSWRGSRAWSWRTRAPSRSAAALLTVLAGWQVRHFGASSLEYDFSHLRRRDTWTSGRGLLGQARWTPSSAATSRPRRS